MEILTDFFKNNLSGIFIIGIFTSSIATFLYIVFTNFLKPKLEISPFIAKGISTKNGQIKYTIKVVNRSWFSLFDIEARLHIMKKFQTATGDINKSSKIEFVQSRPFLLAPFDKKNDDPKNSFRFLTYENIEEKWQNDQIEFLLFRIICRHQYSSRIWYFQNEYRIKKNCVKVGEFDKGNFFNITEVS